MKQVLKLIHRVPLFLTLSVFISVLVIFNSPGVLAQTSGDIRAILNQTPFYDPTEKACSLSGTTSTGTYDGSHGPAIYQSGINPPYILEQMAIETLKAIAGKLALPVSDFVTQEHVVAFVAFAFREGGDINNDDLFNVFNNGINAPDLIEGAHQGNGVQSFKSFDAGVEANARMMTMPGYSRLIDVLSKSDSTAQQFMYALTYFNRYPHNVIWAEASDPAYNNQGQAGQDKYYQGLVRLIEQTRTNYSDMASLVIGTSAHEQKTHLNKPDLLQFNGGQNPSTGGDACSCPSSGTSGSSDAPVVVIDPGHSGTSIKVTDPQTGLQDYDYPNTPEMADVFDVAQLVKARLEGDGYKVLMTKSAANDTVSLRSRADIANQAKAAIAISIHDQAGPSGGIPFATGNNFVYQQEVGLYRQTASGSKVTFGDAGVAAKSQEYAAKFIDARSAAEGHSVSLSHANLNSRTELAPGNIWMVQLFSNVPWIYNEAGGNSAGQNGLNQTDKQKYADGLIGGVEKSVPVNGTGGQSGANCNSGSQSSIVQKALLFSWPERHGLSAKPEYLQSLQQFNPNAPYNGADCGAFVGTVMLASGADPNYPKYGTSVQEAYVHKHPELYDVVDRVNDVGELQPGDIMIVNQGDGQGANGHTYIFVGNQPNGTNEASASGGDRMPNLGTAVLSDGRGYYLRARLKG